MNYIDVCFRCTYYKGTKKNGVCRRYPPRTNVCAEDQCGEFVEKRIHYATNKRDTTAPGSALIDLMLEPDTK